MIQRTCKKRCERTPTPQFFWLVFLVYNVLSRERFVHIPPNGNSENHLQTYLSNGGCVSCLEDI